MVRSNTTLQILPRLVVPMAIICYIGWRRRRPRRRFNTPDEDLTLECSEAGPEWDSLDAGNAEERPEEHEEAEQPLSDPMGDSLDDQEVSGIVEPAAPPTGLGVVARARTRSRSEDRSPEGGDPDIIVNGRVHPSYAFRASGYRRGTRGRGMKIKRYAYLPEYSEVHEFVWARMMKRTFAIYNPGSLNDLEVEAEHRFMRDGFWFDHIDMNGVVTRRRVDAANVQQSILARMISAATDLSHPTVRDIVRHKAAKIKRGREIAWDDYYLSQDRDIDSVGVRIQSALRGLMSAVGLSAPLPPRK